MRTIYLGNSFKHNLGQRPTFTHKADDKAPRGDDMPVFDRAESGHREEYERPYRDEDDGVWIKRGRR